MNNFSNNENLYKLLKSQKFAVISTQGENAPYTNLISFVASNGIKNLVFATNKDTKKYQNIKSNSKVSILIDNRDNTESDIQKAIVVTGIGTAYELEKDVDFYKDLYLKKHPYLTNFVNTKKSVFIDIKINKYIVVNRFKNVEVINF